MPKREEWTVYPIRIADEFVQGLAAICTQRSRGHAAFRLSGLQLPTSIKSCSLNTQIFKNHVV